MNENDANVSFKREKFRLNCIYLNRICSIRKLFSYKFAKILKERTLLIDIDKSSINRNVKPADSYRANVSPIESQNFIFVGSISLIMAISYSGAWISKITNKTIDSEKYGLWRYWFLALILQLFWTFTNNTSSW